MKFLKVTATTYIGTHGYSLIELRDGSFSVIKNSKVTKWGNGFQTVRAAEIFMNSHDYINATAQYMPIKEDDMDFISEFYGFKKVGKYDYKRGNNLTMHLEPGTRSIYFWYDNKYTNEMDLTDALDWLDKRIYSSEVFAKVVFRGTEFRSKAILASMRPQDLMRVKSSNVWAIGTEVKESNRKLGDVYVQFKGKNGGPGDTYRYYDVPLTLYRKMISYPSKGAFVWKYLRNNFQYSKLTGDKKGKLRNAIN